MTLDGLFRVGSICALLLTLTTVVLAEPELETEMSPVDLQLLDYRPDPTGVSGYSPREVVASRPLERMNRNRVSQRGYMWPVPGAILSPFGPRGGRAHLGLDLDGNRGDRVVAARAGMVITAGAKYSGYGNMVDILHEDGMVTRYAHATRVLVQVGQQVAQGQTVMTLGCTGRCSGPHVHFEIRQGGRAVNPTPYLR
ncbi:M23 family metallopeptidase [Candidatus Cyanaurora vandensis]|uniref:M23 family metallopeptidase n=1 Tax=Candidatus Cyanaurora vandensis TaxID=2714958 RepID=UPI002579D57B|nr:M23 family metallopeptidase [Candidatus Cyanaurora vandensis]